MGAIDSFLKIAIRDFPHIASIFPSSSFAARAVAKQVPEDAKIVVEYGPGSGSITRELLRRLSSTCRIVCIEVNEEFIPILKGLGDPRLEIITGDVVEMSGQLLRLFPGGV